MASSFLNRWSQRKLEQNNPDSSDTSQQNEMVNDASSVADVDQHIQSIEQETSQVDVPVVGSHDEPQSVASLLASEAEAAVKKAALRKLFLSGEFSEVDRLNDYDHDYQSVKTLSSDVAAKLRDWINEEPEAEQESDPVESKVEYDTNQRPDSLELGTDNAPMVSDDVEPNVDLMGQNIPHEK